MTKQDLIRMMMEELGYSRRDSKDFIDKTFGIIKTAILGGESARIANFGSFIVRKKGKRIGRNPKTKQEYEIKERTTVVFRPSTNLRKELKKQ
jgi:integration host factor subunit alpha